MKAERNKTIDLSVEEGGEYLARCVTVRNRVPLAAVLDRTILGDTFSAAKQLPPKCVDLLIVDPPYNLDKDFHGRKFKKRSDEACCDWQSSPVVGMTLKKYFHIQNRITWQREKGRGALRNWKNGMEDIWFATVSKTYTFHVDDVKIRRRVIAPYRVDGKPKDWEETAEGNFRNTYPSNFWDDISIPYWSMPENTGHPTQKPEKLIAKLILASSDPGDVVFDPFAGSGTTAVTAKKLGRHFISIEQNEQYCVWAEKRLEMADDDKTIQGYADGVFWERNTSSLQQKKQKRE